MKKMVLLGIVAVVVLGFTGCVSYRTNDQASQAVSTTILPVYYEAEVETGTEQVTGTASINSIFLFTWGAGNFADRCELAGPEANAGGSLPLLLPIPIALPLPDSPVEKAKSAAVYNACLQAKCDAIAAAKYTIEIDNYFVFKRIKATVKGFPVVQKSLKRVDVPAGK